MKAASAKCAFQSRRGPATETHRALSLNQGLRLTKDPGDGSSATDIRFRSISQTVGKIRMLQVIAVNTRLGSVALRRQPLDVHPPGPEKFFAASRTNCRQNVALTPAGTAKGGATDRRSAGTRVPQHLT